METLRERACIDVVTSALKRGRHAAMGRFPGGRLWAFEGADLHAATEQRRRYLAEFYEIGPRA